MSAGGLGSGTRFELHYAGETKRLVRVEAIGDDGQRVEIPATRVLRTFVAAEGLERAEFHVLGLRISETWDPDPTYKPPGG